MSHILAIISGGIVENVIVGSPGNHPASVDVTHMSPRPAPGWTYSDGQFSPGAPPEPDEPEPEPAPVRHITNLAFDNRFTVDELVNIRLASLVEPGMTVEQKRQALGVEVLLERAKKATYVDLDREDTRGGVMQFEAFGLIAEGRALEILDAPIQPHEVPKA